MRIFIDEAGIFVDPNQTNQHKVSILGGLVIPDYSYAAVIKFFNAKKTEWGIHGEVKGSKLNESQVDSLIRGLESYNVLFDAVIVDTKFTTPTAITKHKSGFSQYLLKSISPYHHLELAQQIKTLSADLETFSDQDYIQNIAKASLIHHVHEISTLFYVQRRPSELARFKWVIDAKDLRVTKAEKWWTDTLKPILQGMSWNRPLMMLKGADYSHYEDFNITKDDHVGGDISKIVNDLTFRDSKLEDGLQLVDILTNSLRRALNGKFQHEGWQNFGRLMVSQKGQNVLSITLEGESPQKHKVPYFYILDAINQQSHSMFL